MTTPETTNGTVRITNREIYDGLLSVRDGLRDLANTVKNAVDQNEELKGRVRSLELKYYGVLASLITGGAVWVFDTLRGNGGNP